MVPRPVIVLGALAAVLAAGFVRLQFDGALHFRLDGAAVNALIDRLQGIGVFCVVVERATQVTLVWTDRDGPERTTPMSDAHATAAAEAPQDARRPALAISFSIGLVIACLGLGLIDVMVEAGHGPLAYPAGLLWRGADALLVAGLLSGGAAVFHEVPETIKAVLRRTGPRSEQ